MNGDIKAPSAEASNPGLLPVAAEASGSGQPNPQKIPPVEAGAKLLSPKDVISSWGRLMESVCVSPADFYARVESALELRKIPKVEVCRVDWKEGGVLSARREYLRVKRERLVFDVCGAPFGTGFFVSSRLAFVPLEFGVGDYIAIAIVLALFFVIKAMGTLLWALFGMGCLLAVLLLFMRVAVVRGLADVDNALLELPVLNVVYERFFRRLTYFRIDSTRMYQQAVHSAVMDAVDEILNKQGLRPLTAEEKKPVLKEIYRIEG